MFAILPLPDIDACLAEIGHAFDTLGADGIVLMSNYDGHYIGTPAFWPIFEELNRRKAIVLVHPSAPKDFTGFSAVSLSTLEFPFDTARAMTSVLFHGVPARYNQIKFIGRMPAASCPISPDGPQSCRSETPISSSRGRTACWAQ